MNSHATLATAAVVLVILPLLITIATLGANIVVESTGAHGILGPADATSLIVGGWSVVAVGVVGALIAVLLRDQVQH
jgi:hypothetical protein